MVDRRDLRRWDGCNRRHYLREVGRPVPGPDTEAGPMVARNTLVSAVRA
jgi:hypothetical protein